MAKWQPKQAWQRYLYSPLAIGLMALLVLLLGARAWRGYSTYRLAEDEREQATADLEALNARQKELAADVALLQSDAGVEQKLRQKFSVAKEGEKVIAVIAPEAEASQSDKVESEKKWWQFWRD
jgi:cell division protein FtsB